MELFFPLVLVFAVAVAAVAATACILVPGPKHLVSKVFLGTIGFIFGGAVCTSIVDVISGLTLNKLAPSLHPATTVITVLTCMIFVSVGATYSWAVIRLVDLIYSLLRSGRDENNPPESEGTALPPKSHLRS